MTKFMSFMRSSDARVRRKIAQTQLDLSGPAGKKAVLESAKRVLATHRDVIAALAKRYN